MPITARSRVSVALEVLTQGGEAGLMSKLRAECPDFKIEATAYVVFTRTFRSARYRAGLLQQVRSLAEGSEILLAYRLGEAAAERK